MIPQSLEKQIKAEANRLGFALCGITTADASEGFSHYKAWVEKGLFAGMHYLARPDALAKRQKPELLLAGCKSLICVGLPYPPAESLASIAAYVRVPDYHLLMREKLTQLASFIEELTGTKPASYIAVDSVAVLEKSFAHRAGLGLVGKNTLLLNEDFGTWFFLGELLLDLELEPDLALASDFCGDCRICVEACPTNALLGDKTMDASKCLSYLTIEHRGSIPVEYREAMGQQVFGCDICQLICPKNENASSSGFAFCFKPTFDGEIDLIEALSLREADFKLRYAGSSFLRAKYQGFRRNVIIALGNSQQARALAVLEAALPDEQDPVCKESMLWAIERLKKMLQ